MKPSASPRELQTPAQIFDLAQKIADCHAEAGALTWEQWDLNSRDDFWDSAAPDLGVPGGHALRLMPDEYATPMRPPGE